MESFGQTNVAIGSNSHAVENIKRKRDCESNYSLNPAAHAAVALNNIGNYLNGSMSINT